MCVTQFNFSDESNADSSSTSSESSTGSSTSTGTNASSASSGSNNIEMAEELRERNSHIEQLSKAQGVRLSNNKMSYNR